MNRIDELNHKFGEEQESLARIDVDISQAEVSLMKEEKYSLDWYHALENLNSLNRKKQMIVSRMVDLRMLIEKVKIVVI